MLRLVISHTQRHKCLLHAKFGNHPYPDDIDVYNSIIHTNTNVFLLEIKMRTSYEQN
jgi:hypothetical protein